MRSVVDANKIFFHENPRLVCHCHFHDNFCYSISSDVKIDKMCTSSFDMSLIWKFYIMFLKINMPLLFDTSDDFMFIYSSKYLSIFSLESELEFLPIEKLLYYVSFFEFESSLIFRFFLFLDQLFHAFRSDLFGKSFRDKHIARLRARYFDDISFSSDMSDIGKEFHSEQVCSHKKDGVRQSQYTQNRLSCNNLSLIHINRKIIFLSRNKIQINFFSGRIKVFYDSIVRMTPKTITRIAMNSPICSDDKIYTHICRRIYCRDLFGYDLRLRTSCFTL